MSLSKEQLKAFLEKVKSDTSLQKKLKAEGADPVAIAKAAGFSFSAEDINTHRQTLSAYELENVSGRGADTFGGPEFACTYRLYYTCGGC